MWNHDNWLLFIGTCLVALICSTVSLCAPSSVPAHAAPVKPVLAWQLQLPEKEPLMISGVNSSCLIVRGDESKNGYDSWLAPLYAIRLADGKSLWKQSFSNFTGTTLDNDNVYFISVAGKDNFVLEAISLQDGTLRWRHEGVELSDTILTGGGRVIVTDEHGGLVALMPSTGEQVWTIPVQELVLQRRPKSQGYPLGIVDGILYAGRQYLSAIDVATGNIIRQRQIPHTESALYQLFAPIKSAKD